MQRHQLGFSKRQGYEEYVVLHHTLEAAGEQLQQQEQSRSKGIGSAQISDTEYFSGWMQNRKEAQAQQLQLHKTQVGSLAGDVRVHAGGSYRQQVADVVAAKDIHIEAAQIEAQTAHNTGSQSSSERDLKVGVFAKVSSPLIDLANAAEAASKNAHGDSRTQALQGMAAAAQGYQAYDAAVNGALAKVEVGVGYKSAKHRNEEHYATSQANQLAAGGDVTLKSTQGDIALNNTQVKAGQEISVDSARAIKLASGQSQLQAQGDNKSSSVMVGVGASVGAQTGVYAYVEVGTAKGEHQLDANTQQDTTLQAQQVSLKSKHDTTLQGAQVTAKRINADVGGKLHIESLQDQVTQSSSQSSAGVKVQAGLGTAWGASGNYANSEANGSSATVNRQSGLFAGDGGYHINAGSVQLKGGAIASTADKEHNTLSTNSFAASDITNASSFEASSVNLGAGYGSGAGQGASFNPALPQHASGSSTSTTKATLTEGNIVINGTSTTAQALGVNTDASSAHQKTQELPDLQALQAKQQAVAQATATIAGAVQTFSQNQAKEAQKAQETAQTEFEQTLKNSNPEGYAAYQKLDDSSKQNILLADSKYAEAYNAARDWGIGGSNSRLLNAATTLVTGVLGGQTNLQVAANTVAPYAAQAIGQAVGHGDNKNEAAQAVGHMLLGAALAYANHANPVAGGVAAVAAEKAAEYLAQHYNDGKTALDPITGQFNANLLPEEVKQEIKALTGIAASLAGAVGTIGTGSAFNAQVAGVVGQNAASSNRFLSSNEIKQAQEWAKKSGGRYTPAQIMDALRWATNKQTGKKWNDDTKKHLANLKDYMGAETSDAQVGYVGVTDENGLVLQQVMSKVPQPTPEIIAFLKAVSKNQYDWDTTSMNVPRAQAPATLKVDTKGTFVPASNGCLTAECAANVARNNDGRLRDSGDVRKDVVKGAEGVSRTAGVVGSAATVAAATPGPHQPEAAALALTATGVGLVADGVVQALEPNVGGQAQQTVLTIIQNNVDRKYPLAAPVTNEVIEIWKQSPASNNINNYINNILN